MRDRSLTALVTGASGFIGREVVLRLLADRWIVYAFVRPGTDSIGARLAAALGVSVLPPNLRVVPGDLARENAGLSSNVVRHLKEEVDVLFHCAGDTSFAPENQTRFVRGHVQGPVALLKLVAHRRLFRCVHLSTAFICGTRSGIVYEHEDDVGQGFHNAYERAKLASEQAMRRAATLLGIDLCVVRPSIVIGPPHSTTGAVPSDRLLRFVALLASAWAPLGRIGLQLRIESAPEAPFNIVPLDYVVDAVMAFGRMPRTARTSAHAYHIVAADAPCQRDVLELLNSRLKLQGVSLVASRGSAPSFLEQAVDRLTSGYREYLHQDVQFDDRHARNALSAHAITAPRIDDAYIERLVSAAVGRDVGVSPAIATRTGASPLARKGG